MMTPLTLDPTLAADREARRLAQQEMVRPLVIEAGAGTGKTATLVSRVLAWTLGTGWRRAAEQIRSKLLPAGAPPQDEGLRIAARVLRRVVAITFTEAAAAEMAERVATAFAQVAEGDTPVGFDPALALGTESALDDAHCRQRAQALRAAADQLQVHTIHGFSRQLLAAHPFDAGVHPNFTVDADGTVLREVVEACVEAALMKAYAEDADPDHLALAARGIGPQRIAEVVIELAQLPLPANALADDPFDDAGRKALVTRLAAAVEALRAAIGDRFAGVGRAKNAQAIADGLATLAGQLAPPYAAPPSIEELQAWVEEALPLNLTTHLKKWIKGKPSQTESKCFGLALAAAAEAAATLRPLLKHIRALDAALLHSARRVCGPLLAAVRTAMHARGALTFADLLRLAHHLLSRSNHLVAQLRAGIDQLLVDEFQDTDSLQCELVRRLALDGPVAARPGLFVVGDPKQSIYGWRNADLAAYEAFVAVVEQAGGQRLPLVENFRSAPPILAEVERVIAPVMVPWPGLQPAFQPLLACAAKRDEPGFNAAGRTPVEHWVSWTPDAEGRPERRGFIESAALEARAVATDLRRLHDKAQVGWGEVALLMRSTTDLEIYLAALREADVPFVVSRDRQYYRRREIIEAAALVRTVLAPEDHLALLTFLRSAAVGVPDGALLPLWSRELPRLLTEVDQQPREEALSALRALVEAAAREVSPAIPGIERVAGWEASLIHALECIVELRTLFDEAPADRFVARLRGLLLFEAGEAARYLGSYRAANLERFFREVLEALETLAGDRHQVLRTLRARVAEGLEAEEAPPPDTAADAVQVMTIHKAKGLQFRHVYLLQLHKETGALGTPPVQIEAHGGQLEYALFGAPTPGFDRVARHRAAVESAELVRTLYVAMTRAAERLVIVASRDPRDEERPPKSARTHADLLAHRQGVSPHLLTQWQAAQAQEIAAGVLWYLPAHAHLPGEDDAIIRPQPVAHDLPSVATVADAQTALEARRNVAAIRMARPFLGEASKQKRPLATVDEPALPVTPNTAAVPTDAPPSGGREVAMAAGTLVHRVLECFDLAATDPHTELAYQRQCLDRYLADLPEVADQAPLARRRAEALLDRFAQSALLDRFWTLRGQIVARELPVVLPIDDEEEGATGFVSGSIDLLYRDLETGTLVVADYKTDLVAPAAASAYAQRYAGQGATYTEALTTALDLSERPRCELWFLHGDCVVAL